MASEANRIVILLIVIITVGCNGVNRAPTLSQENVQKTADNNSKISASDKGSFNFNRETCPQHCNCAWYEKDSNFLSIDCFLANVTQGKSIVYLHPAKLILRP